MRDIALLVFAAVLVSELLLRLPLLAQVRHILAVTRKSAATIRSSRISDHWKERALPAYSVRMGARSLLFLLLLCVATSPVLAVGLAAPGGPGRWFALLATPLAVAILCVASILYILLRTRFRRG